MSELFLVFPRKRKTNQTLVQIHNLLNSDIKQVKLGRNNCKRTKNAQEISHECQTKTISSKKVMFVIFAL